MQLACTRPTGGIQTSWDEQGFAHWQPFSSLIPPTLLYGSVALFAAPLLLLDLIAAQLVRYFQTDSGQLGIQFARGLLGQAVIEGYKLDLDKGTATGGITVFGVDWVPAGAGQYQAYKNYLDIATKAAFGYCARGTDPLVIDFDRDGLDLTRLGDGVRFDIDGDSFAERTAWVTGGDAFLARDLNGDGKINNQGELFGNATKGGFAALVALDGNNNKHFRYIAAQ